MGLAIFYDPCLHCEHKNTKKMCSMCLFAYLRNTATIKTFDSEEEKDEQRTSETE